MKKVINKPSRGVYLMSFLLVLVFNAFGESGKSNDVFVSAFLRNILIILGLAGLGYIFSKKDKPTK